MAVVPTDFPMLPGPVERIGEVVLISSASVWSGQLFQPIAERELLPALMELASDQRAAPDGFVLAIPEFVGPYGITDLLAVSTSESQLRVRLDSEVPAIRSQTDAAVVASLTPVRGTTADQVAGRLGVSEAAVASRIDVLIRAGAVTETSTGRFVRHEGLKPLGIFHAFESKTRDWRGGLDQARTYGLWADRSSTVLAHIPRSADHVRREASRSGVGLAHWTTWLKRPRLRRHERTRRFWTSEHVAAAALGV